MCKITKILWGNCGDGLEGLEGLDGLVVEKRKS
jgi:hypothetical protein